MILVLWDIDGTLIDSGPATQGVYPIAFTLLTGRALTQMVDIDGRTELDSMAEILQLNDAAWPGTPRVCEVLAAGMRAQLELFRAQGTVLPGAVAALAALRDRDTVVQTLLTGNIRANAEMKLSAFGLEGYIDFEAGGYGSDDKVRSKLVAIAQARAGRRYGQVFDGHSTVVIGDTIRDIDAARVGGARVIAVATGATSVDDLKAANPDVLLTDLGDWAALERAILDSPDSDGRAK